MVHCCNRHKVSLGLEEKSREKIVKKKSTEGESEITISTSGSNSRIWLYLPGRSVLKCHKRASVLALRSARLRRGLPVSQIERRQLQMNIAYAKEMIGIWEWDPQ